MVSLSSIQFIDAALYGSTSFALSYTDPEQKWVIREHLITLLQEFPSLNPSMNTFTHNDGATVNLLNINGDLSVSRSVPAIFLTIWVHENYPSMAPIVFLSPNSMYPIHPDHPFVDSSGSITSPYLQTWFYPRSNLSEFVHNLVKLFSHNHPFYCYSTTSSATHLSIPSKMEAMDRLVCKIHHDMRALRTKTDEEIEELSSLQAEMVKRVDVTTGIIIGLDEEREKLKERVRDLSEEADVLINWLRVYDKKYSGGTSMVGDDIDDVFEAVDEESKMIIDWKAEDMGLEDLIYELDKAVEKGVVSFRMYITQVRSLAREQFYHRNRLVKLKGTKILHLPY
ncbi:unnamed protein product [Ilex paraguariensis]|uniref:Protein ELC-like n=1 Tax=Ilex paraguariensis TaxID=185542 RepID=A0ABC8RFM8_9AQUA